MTGRVTDIWRHPIKSHGREQLESVTLEIGKTLPFDRHWAVAHERSKADGSKWISCGHFCRVAKIPALMAITSKFDEITGTVELKHPDLGSLTFNPDTDEDQFLTWITPIVPPNTLQPTRLVRADGDAFTDSDFPSVTLCNHASHRAVEQRVGKPLSRHRWRGNVWIEGLAPWEEFDWDGKQVRIGEVVLSIRERTDRCKSTHANPDTGERDADILSALDSWGHQDFSVRAEVIQGGRISTNDPVERI